MRRSVSAIQSQDFSVVAPVGSRLVPRVPANGKMVDLEMTCSDAEDKERYECDDRLVDSLELSWQATSASASALVWLLACELASEGGV